MNMLRCVRPNPSGSRNHLSLYDGLPCVGILRTYPYIQLNKPDHPATVSSLISINDKTSSNVTSRSVNSPPWFLENREHVSSPSCTTITPRAKSKLGSRLAHWVRPSRMPCTQPVINDDINTRPSHRAEIEPCNGCKSLSIVRSAYWGWVTIRNYTLVRACQLASQGGGEMGLSRCHQRGPGLVPTGKVLRDINMENPALLSKPHGAGAYERLYFIGLICRLDSGFSVQGSDTVSVVDLSVVQTQTGSNGDDIFDNMD
ncbi:hypothetical protein V8F06_004079 [Rhypophila decipiens]